jgi:hypothetical protein
VSLFDTLYSQKAVKITLSYPFDSLYKSNNEDIEASISIQTAGGFLLRDEPMVINLRGKFRRMKCTMPPLLLNFKKSTLREMNLATIDEMKLVTHCIAGPDGQQNLAEEFLIYQLYESLTPVSYRSLWVNVDYCNKSNPGECIQSVGFLLEPDKVISSRLRIEEKKLYNVPEDSIQFESYSLAAAFNFLIGNRDWSIIASRNAKLFYNPSIGKFVVIPYDFDYANIVGASYRRETLPAGMVHPFDRLYQGEYYETRSGEILKTFHVFEKHLSDKIFSADNPLEVERRKQINKYFNQWFDMIKKTKDSELRYGIICPYTGGL